VLYCSQKSAVLWCIVPPPNPLLFPTHCIYVTFSVLHFCVWSVSLSTPLVTPHHSLHHSPEWCIARNACIADGVFALGRADLSRGWLVVAGLFSWTTTKRWPLASWNPPSSGGTRPTSLERGYYPRGVVKGSSAVLLPFVSVLRAGRALFG
jgi:hypothetical protein